MQNSEGKWSPLFYGDAEVRTRGHIRAFKFSRAAGELTQERGESACARGRQESAVFM